MIPEAAVTAATKALYWHPASNGSGKDAPDTWTACESAAREILEAAAPHMLAGAWRAGEEAGQDNADSNRGFDIEHKRNPYEATP